MKTVTIADVLSFHPCWENARERMEKIAERYSRQEWSALDVLRMPKTLVSNTDKLWLVLREELIDAPVLHEFACRCAEHALPRIDNPDPRSVAAIAAKRAWLRGEITDKQLESAQDAAYAAYWAADYVAYLAADGAADCDANQAAYWAACWDDCAADNDDAEREWQVAELIKILEVES